jgi:hypothetical protein
MFQKLLLVSLSAFVTPALVEESQKVVTSSSLRGLKNDETLLDFPPHPGRSHHSSYQGCVSYSKNELSTKWTFRGQPPNCSWIHAGYYVSAGSNNTGEITGNEEGSTGNEGSDGGSSNGGGSKGHEGIEDSSFNDGGNSENGGGAEVSTNDDAANGEKQQNDDFFVPNEDAPQEETDYDPMTDFDIESVSCKDLKT